jgi:hypothetical protein
MSLLLNWSCCPVSCPWFSLQYIRTVRYDATWKNLNWDVRLYKIMVQTHVRPAVDRTYPTLRLTDLFDGEEEPSQVDGEDIVSLVSYDQVLSQAIYVLS